MNIYNELEKLVKRHPGGIHFRLKKHAKVVSDFINDSETVRYVFYGQKNNGVTEIFNTFVIVLTSERILLGHKGIIWGKFLYSVTPDLYNDLQVYSGLLFGKIIIDTVKEEIVLSNLPKGALDEIETNITEFMLEAKKKYKNEESK